ncbi:MAG: hypothetical protein A2Y10_13725 [Planctomycetes bacterium GWF2_41_51]|nr:MAG: hypothetical protein A2Y10_13725 [Planctomycetes bacterium GWF2_41_51]HBG25991.1 sialate O-acetylesterase [Phycisphaerales bacterium]
MKRFLCLAIIAFSSSISIAAITLPSIISDNMVLQADSIAPIWGNAEPNSKITICPSWNKETIVTESDDQGKWTAKIKTPKKGKKCKLIISCGKESRTITNILIGQVWLCSGQSNMQWTVKQSTNADKELLEAKFPNIRLFSVKRAVAEEPQNDCFGQWVECNAETAAEFSAVGYYFGKKLHKKLRTPVGLINSSYGGTPAQSWTSKDTLINDPSLKQYVITDANNKANKDVYEKQYAQTLNEWKKEVMKTVAAGKPAKRKPKPPLELREEQKSASIYNAMIHPLIPFAIKGVIWYQGESNASNADNAILYRTLFPAMISNWRNDWQQGDFPFYYVQLAAFGKTDLTKSNWALLREAQTMTLSLPNTGMAVAMDIGEPNNIHPKNKQEVGKRLAIWAFAKDYGYKNIIYSGPIYKSMQIEDDKIRIFFDYAKSGLKTPKRQSLKGFAIAGENGKFVWANATIEDGTVLVWSDQIKNPKHVRYGWTDYIECNLYNKKNLPASPFRTDNF